MDRLGFHDTGEFLVQATVEVGQVLVIQTHEVEDRGVQIPQVMAVDHGGLNQKLTGVLEAQPIHGILG